MFHRNKKLNKADLEELRERQKMINQYLLVAKALNEQRNVFIQKLIAKMGLNKEKKYTIDLKSGIIKEIN